MFLLMGRKRIPLDTKQEPTVPQSLPSYLKSHPEGVTISVRAKPGSKVCSLYNFQCHIDHSRLSIVAPALLFVISLHGVQTSDVTTSNLYSGDYRWSKAVETMLSLHVDPRASLHHKSLEMLLGCTSCVCAMNQAPATSNRMA